MSHIVKEQKRITSAPEDLPIVWVEGCANSGGLQNQYLGIARKINPACELHSHLDIADLKFGRYQRGKIPDIIVGSIKPYYGNVQNRRMIGGRTKNIFYVTSIDCGGDLVYGDSAKLHLPHNHVKGIGVPHAVTKEQIEIGKKEWADQFSGLPHPQIAVLLGGDCSEFEFTEEKARKMAREIATKTKELGGALIITNSRRTSDVATNAFMDVIHKEYAVPAYLHDWRLDAAKGNPYFGVLGVADAIIVAGDSQSMCCEANVSRKPVYIYTSEGTRKHDEKLHQQLYDRKLAKPFADFIEKGIERWQYEPLDTAGDIAREALKFWRERQKSWRLS